MKNAVLILVLASLFLSPYALLGQDSVKSNYSLQLTTGLSRTFHYNQPVSFVFCFEGCFPEEQKPRTTPSIDVSLYRHFNQRNSLKLGFGASSYKYWERGQANNGDGRTFSPYELVSRRSFYGLSLGYRYIFNPEKKIHIFMEYDLSYEIPVEDYPRIKSGLAIAPKLGLILNLSNNWNLICQGFFKSALTKYNDKSFDNDYIPYAYGFQLGVNLSL